LGEGSWIDDHESVIVIGDSGTGTGKTMLATGLAVCACHQGRRVRFTTLAGLAKAVVDRLTHRAHIIDPDCRVSALGSDLGIGRFIGGRKTNRISRQNAT
jgi:IstB-like ATP binding protein